MTPRFLTALPVYNEAGYVNAVLDEVAPYSEHVLVVNDGSSDGTAELLAARCDVQVVTHSENQGYGGALAAAFRFAVENEFDVLVTIDCDGQHQPRMIPEFVAACEQADVVSGSRYLKKFEGDSQPPEQRRAINSQLTREINERLGLRLTDAFCGFKAYRSCALRRFKVTDAGYAMPLELWVQIAKLQLQVQELPVPLIYLDDSRSFGGSLDDAETRLAHYRQVLEQSSERYADLKPVAKGGPLSGACSP